MPWPEAEQVKRRLGITSDSSGIDEDVALALAAAIEQVEADVGRVGFALASSAAADDILHTQAAHGFRAGDKVQFLYLTGGDPLATGTDYFILEDELDDSAFQLSASLDGPAVDLTTDIASGDGAIYKVLEPTASLSAAALLLAVACFKAVDAPHGVAAIFDTGGIYVARANPHYERLLVGQRETFGIA